MAVLERFPLPFKEDTIMPKGSTYNTHPRFMKAIVAVDNNWGIGYKGDLLAKVPEDMKHFKEHTKNSVIIMGRRTLESFPNKQPLPNRTNIILTRDPNYKVNGNNAIVVNSLDSAYSEAYRFANHGKRIYVIGGGEIYRHFLQSCDIVYVTRFYKDFAEVDTHFPNLENEGFYPVVESTIREHNGLNYKFITYKYHE